MRIYRNERQLAARVDGCGHVAERCDDGAQQHQQNADNRIVLQADRGDLGPEDHGNSTEAEQSGGDKPGVNARAEEKALVYRIEEHDGAEDDGNQAGCDTRRRVIDEQIIEAEKQRALQQDEPDHVGGQPNLAATDQRVRIQQHRGDPETVSNGHLRRDVAELERDGGPGRAPDQNNRGIQQYDLHALLPRRACGPGLEAKDLVGSSGPDVILRAQHDVGERAVGDVQPAVRAVRQSVGPAQAG